MVWWLRWVDARALNPVALRSSGGRRMARRPRGPYGLPRMVAGARGRAPVGMLLADPQLGRFDWRTAGWFALLGFAEGAVAWGLKSWAVLWLVVGAPLTMGVVSGMAYVAVVGFVRRAEEAGKLRELMATDLWPGDVDSGLLVFPAAWVAAGLVAMEAPFLVGLIGGAARGEQPFFALLGVILWVHLRLAGLWLAARCGLYRGWRHSMQAMRRGSPIPAGWEAWFGYVRGELKPAAVLAVALPFVALVVVAAPGLTIPVGIAGAFVGLSAVAIMGTMEDDANVAAEVLMAEGCSIADVPEPKGDDDDNDLKFDTAKDRVR